MLYALDSNGRYKSPSKGDIGICPWCGEEVGAWMCFAPVTSHYKHAKDKGAVCELRERNAILSILIAVAMLYRPSQKVTRVVVETPHVDRMGNKLYWDTPVVKMPPPVPERRLPIVCNDGLIFERIDSKEQMVFVTPKPSAAYVIDYNMGEYPMKVSKNKKGRLVHMFDTSAECLIGMQTKLLIKINDNLYYHPQETYDRNRATGKRHGWGKTYTKEALLERINTIHGGVK